VTEIWLQGCGLSGTIPQGSTFSIVGLKSVNLAQEKNKGLLGIEGTLPADIASCTALESLEFYGNNLNGTLPNFSNLTNLKLLDLHFNKFTGALPTLSAKNISYVSFAKNFLTGRHHTCELR
jgi:Leucine-rich repeat (LRR) protein